ncbi:unnamed protein product [Dovyalis caffra]|uniref:Uncharacterized protein n=1 Tax=Dovyalis caffra TaxID=77055 RepID=A0AAV1SU37_9ROSI|nr:unnamed protein product [Dovyalis caffra]
MAFKSLPFTEIGEQLLFLSKYTASKVFLHQLPSGKPTINPGGQRHLHKDKMAFKLFHFPEIGKQLLFLSKSTASKDSLVQLSDLLKGVVRALLSGGSLQMMFHTLTTPSTFDFGKEQPRHGEDRRGGLEMQPEYTSHAHRICISRALPESKFVSSAEGGFASFVVQHN